MKVRGKGIESGAGPEQGTALIFAAVIAIGLAGLAVSMLATNLSTEKVRDHDKGSQRSFYAAEAGLSEAYALMSEGQLALDADGQTFFGSPDAPRELGPMSYWVEINQLGTRAYSLAATGQNDGFQERLELVLKQQPTGFFQFACFGSEGVLLESNAFIDSYDSILGTYESQVQGGNDFARENGNVGSNEDIVLRSNTEIHGDALPGPGGVVDDSAPRTYISGATDPAEEEFPMPPIVVPSIATSGSLTSSRDLVLGPGQVHYTSLRMQGGTKLTIKGPAQVVLDDYLMRSGAEMIFDATDGEIELYGTKNFILESNTDMTTMSQTALDVTIFLSGNNMDPGRRDRVQLSSNADFVGAIYAPRINYKLESNFNVFGSIICGYLDLSSNGQIHFDEALLYDGDGDNNDYDVALWHRLPHQ